MLLYCICVTDLSGLLQGPPLTMQTSIFSSGPLPSLHLLNSQLFCHAKSSTHFLDFFSIFFSHSHNSSKSLTLWIECRHNQVKFYDLYYLGGKTMLLGQTVGAVNLLVCSFWFYGWVFPSDLLVASRLLQEQCFISWYAKRMHIQQWVSNLDSINSLRFFF